MRAITKVIGGLFFLRSLVYLDVYRCPSGKQVEAKDRHYLCHEERADGPEDQEGDSEVSVGDFWSLQGLHSLGSDG